jgi:hypothetical protein
MFICDLLSQLFDQCKLNVLTYFQIFHLEEEQLLINVGKVNNFNLISISNTDSIKQLKTVYRQ